MNGRGSKDEELDKCEREEVGSDARPTSGAGSGDESLPPTQSLAPSPKRSRRAVEKRVMTVPISETKGGGEGAPPPDSWAWRKYGQKPIKGSPYPRGYYRCSSSKGCPARKQVERSRLDPAVIMVTYSFDHNHSWPLPKNHHKYVAPPPPPSPLEEQAPPAPLLPQSEPSLPESIEGEEDAKFSDLISEESSLLSHQQWFPVDVCSTASTSPSAAGSSELLYGSVFFAEAEAAIGSAVAATLPEEREESFGDDEEDSLFAGLGELPEYSVVLRRELASASWVGTTG
ncbi:probable WRKY transcription factor 65 [Zingiber officinale]|uniref:WRKY domain-containing protein n=1 Tax=Zingiber officinale TaxID=94328 RepID=A0A8J5CD54_ZINOF|nr:probable WRKY transcription factor 65 [Zingiber officinale]KAG6473019.1 hypothetical protein ZIOFF_066926 [Zingiber officinale]